MQSYFPKALLYREWMSQRPYLAVGVLLLSCVTLVPFLGALSASRELIRYNVEKVDLPGLGFLVLGFGAGLALLTVRDIYKDGGVRFASEPFSPWAMLRTKFIVGLAIVVVSQTAVIVWLGVALACLHAIGPIMTLVGYWLVSTLIGLAFYTTTFVCILIVRPLIFGLLFTCAAHVAPLFVAEWFIRPWITYYPDGSQNRAIPHWGLQVYEIIRDISPYGIIHIGQDVMVSHPWATLGHMALPLVWPVGAFLLTAVICKRGGIDPTDSEALRHPRLAIVVRAMGTLFAAAILQRYVLHFDNFGPVMTFGQQILSLLFLWLVCHLTATAFMAYSGTRRDRNTKMSRTQLGGDK